MDSIGININYLLMQIIMLLFFLSVLMIPIWAGVWTYKDAKTRGKENPLLLGILITFTFPLGLLGWVLLRDNNK